MTGYGGKLTIVLFGKKGAPKSSIGNLILQKTDRDGFTHDTELSELIENELYAAINTPDMFGEGNNPDQQIIDCMALSYPGPHISLLVIQDRHDTSEDVEQQIEHLRDIFGENITENIIVMLPHGGDIFPLASYCNQNRKYPLEVLNNSNDLHKKLPMDRKFFKYTYENYSEGVVLKRKETLSEKRKAQKMSIDYDRHPGTQFGDASKTHRSSDPGGSQDGPASGSGNSKTGKLNHESDHSNILNIVLLGETRTGKSSSGNTILRNKCFPSGATSVSVTKMCQVENMKIGGTEVRVIDTPDFFNDDLKQPCKDVEDCIKICQTGLSVYLLVFQIGRFTAGEREILKKLEDVLGRIRERTCVLFTRGEDLKDMSIETFISKADTQLKEIVDCCGSRHVFKNTKTDYQQVVELMGKIFHFLPNNQMSRDLKDWGKQNKGQRCTVS
ncbi:GTPase IMAP family member 8 [Oncorhynchus tshawytscha]|nr:GTPase IMAP family member 8 [Oncorhynchus tshawytscha]